MQLNLQKLDSERLKKALELEAKSATADSGMADQSDIQTSFRVWVSSLTLRIQPSLLAERLARCLFLPSSQHKADNRCRVYWCHRFRDSRALLFCRRITIVF